MSESTDPFQVDEKADWWSVLMMILSVVFLVGYSVLILNPNMAATVSLWILVAMSIIWVLFIIEYVLAFIRAGEGWKFVARHWLITLGLIIPAVRPFVLLRYLNQLSFFKKGSANAVRTQVVITAVAFAVMFIYLISLTVFRVERDAPGATILSFGDAIWWACVTITTVGYGDLYPVSLPGRYLAVLLMIGGIAIVGTASALVVSYLNEHTTKVLKAREQQGSPSASRQQK